MLHFSPGILLTSDRENWPCYSLPITRENSFAGAEILDEFLRKKIIVLFEGLHQKDHTNDTTNKAATKIQAAFRAYLERKRMERDEIRRSTNTHFL